MNRLCQTRLFTCKHNHMEDRKWRKGEGRRKEEKEKEKGKREEEEEERERGGWVDRETAELEGTLEE